MSPVPRWLRVALFATAAMNLLGAAAFIPAAGSVRNLAGLPGEGQPIYVATVGMFIFIFGLAYLRCAIAGRADRLFIAVCAAGKLSFFALLSGYFVAGDLPLRAPVAGSGDLAFGALFVVWLVQTRKSDP